VETSSRALEGQQSGVAAAGGTACEKAVDHGNEGPITNPKHCTFPVCSSFSGHSVFKQTLRAYSCVLIVHS
jgi:hypothetical protein